MKITIFVIVLVLKSNENTKISHFRLSQLANTSKHCKNSLTQYGLVAGVLWQIIPHCLQDFVQLIDSIWLGYT